MQTASVSFGSPQMRPTVQRQASSNVKFGFDFLNPDFLKGYGAGATTSLVNIGIWDLIKIGYRKATGTSSTKENIKSIDQQLKEIKERLDHKR